MWLPQPKLSKKMFCKLTIVVSVIKTINMVTNLSTFGAYVYINIIICAGLQVYQKCQLISSKKFPFIDLHVCLSGKVGCCSHSVIKIIENSTK